jgi:glycosyltransferase involved in cell wall biosynthesis
MISVVVPIYNEEELIVRFHVAVSEALKDEEDWEVVYVNDGSADSSLELLKGLQNVDSHVVVVELSRNWGHMGAISAGLDTARGNAVILMDGDFQDPPEILPRFIEEWRRGAEVVIGVRRSRQESRKLLAVLFPLFYRVLGSQGCRFSQRTAREKPLFAGASRVGGLSQRDRLLRPPGSSRRRWQALVHQPDQVCDGRHHEFQLQAFAA